MSKKFPSNVIKYAVILVIAGHFGKELQMINYGSSVLVKVPELTASQTDIVTAVSFVLPLVLVYFGGIFADKYGRRLAWAILLVLYGVGMLWLNTTSLKISTFGFSIIVTILISGACALGRAPIAWLFDHEGKNGLKNAYGLYHVIIALVAFIGIGLKMGGTTPTNVNYILAGSSVLIVMAGVWVMTFPENYGNRSSSWVHIAKSGVNQVLSQRVLQLLIVQGVVMLIASYAKTVLVFTVELESQDFITDVNTYLIIKSVITAFLAGILILLMKTDYKKLLVYPMGFIALFYALLPFVSTPVFFILESGIVLFSFLKMVGVLLLANEVIVENRATTLSLLALFISIFAFLTPFWGPFFYEVGVELLSVVACACTVISLGLLVAAIKYRDGER